MAELSDGELLRRLIQETGNSYDSDNRIKLHEAHTACLVRMSNFRNEIQQNEIDLENMKKRLERRDDLLRRVGDQLFQNEQVLVRDGRTGAVIRGRELIEEIKEITRS